MPVPLLSARVLCVRPIGMTLDYCPVCRSERRFSLAFAQHKKYFLFFDQGTMGHEHHELTCVSCACKLERPSGERPIGVFPEGGAVETFEPEMLPIVRQRIDDCVAMETARVQNRINADQREEMIRHAMYCFSRIYDEEPFERIKPWVMFLLSILMISTASAGVWAFTKTGNVWSLVGAGISVVLVMAALLYWVMTHSPRKRVRTWLALALAPLNPTQEEIRRARAEMQASRIEAGFKIRADKVLAKMRKLQTARP